MEIKKGNRIVVALFICVVVYVVIVTAWYTIDAFQAIGIIINLGGGIRAVQS